MKKVRQIVGIMFDTGQNMTSVIDRPIGLPALHTRNPA
jgi:hypothetical protein